MKKILVILACIVSGVLLAQEVSPQPATGQPAVARRRGRPRGSAPSGGLVHKPIVGKVIHVVNAQQTLPIEEVAKLVKEMRLTHALPFELVACEDSTQPLETVAAVRNAENVGAAILLVENDALPSLLVAPEAAWSIVNMRALKADTPPDIRFRNRAVKEIWRAAALALGASTSAYKPCVLEPVTSLGDLDANLAMRPCPEPCNKIVDVSRKLGIAQLRFASYRQACREGWAPAPTNDVQRAIWTQINSDKERGPSKPLTIAPPAKK